MTHHHPTAHRPPLAYLLDLVPALRARYFSIASSQARHPEQLHLCVAVVRYQTMIHAPRFGVCSSFLAAVQPAADVTSARDAAAAVRGEDENIAPELTAAGGVRAAAAAAADVVPIWLRKGCLSMPADPSAPLIMVGPGTGVAPFRSFVQTREAALGSVALGEGVLYFGCRTSEEDYLFGSEWQAHLRSGSLHELHVAFSRAQQHKVYVQHLMSAHLARLWQLLSANGHVYIAGAANHMPKAVRKALRQAAIEHGGLDEAAADDFMKRLEAQKRLQCETW